MKSSLEHIKQTSEDNHRTLRGYNGTPGFVARITTVEEHIAGVNQKVDEVTDTLRCIKAIGEKLDKFTQYPSLTYLVRHKFKEMVLITFGVVFLVFFIAFPE